MHGMNHVNAISDRHAKLVHNYKYTRRNCLKPKQLCGLKWSVGLTF